MICPNCKEPIHSGFSVCPICKKPISGQQLQPKVISQTYQQSSQKIVSNLVEYKRTCQVCGKIWHSLIARENQVAQNIKSNNCNRGLAICSCNPVGNAEAAQLTRNIEANQSEIQRLRSCPQCSSVNYREEIVSHAN